jgi:hypothetical protein
VGGVSKAGGWAARVDAGTPASRDRTVDALRALAIVGVVLGHWLVSAVVRDPGGVGAVHGDSPLVYRPGLAPVSWGLQSLGPFFFAGGFAAALGARGRRAWPWLRGRAVRLGVPVVAMGAVWAAGGWLLGVVGAPYSTRHLVRSLVTHPLWFLLVYLVLTALTPVLRMAVARVGAWAAVPPLLVVAAVDAVRASEAPPGWVVGLDAVAGWAVPYVLGVALAGGRLSGRAGVPLMGAGVAGGAVLVVAAGYPVSAVGVPGVGWSNLDPPSLFAMALAAVQVGAFLWLRPRLARALRRPAVWAPVVVLNLVAMTVYCWHQSALLLVTFAGLPFGAPAGLLDAPDGGWPLARLGWLPVFAGVLAVLCLVFHRFENGREMSSARPYGRTGGTSATDEERR